MKIIVDEMPKQPKECIFSECTNRMCNSYVCKLWRGRGCEPNRCDFLKPITDYATEESISKDISKRILLKDISK